MSEILFPENVVTIVKDLIAEIDPDWTTVRRPLRPSDPNLAVGVFALGWEPSEHEIGGTPDPSLARYNLSIQSLVKHATEEGGQALHTNMAHRVRTMLYRSTDLRVRLAAASVTSPEGIVERVLKWGVSNQRFRSNEISGQFVYLSVTNVEIDTETV